MDIWPLALFLLFWLDLMANFASTAHLNLIENGEIVGYRDYDVHYDALNLPNYYIICDICGDRKGTTINGNLTSFRDHRGYHKTQLT